MLRGIRKASENWLGRAAMAAVMSVLIGSFAIWGINDIFRGFGRSTLAKIGGVEIPIDQFRQTYNDRLQLIGNKLGHPLPPDQAKALGLDRQVLGELIAQAGLDQTAQNMGLRLSDAEIVRHITSDPHLQDEHGHFDPARFQALLQNMGYSEQRFIGTQRQTVLREQLIDSISGNITPPQAWLDAINQFQNQERSVKYVALGAAQAGDIPQPTADQLASYFNDHKVMFRAPEYRKIETITVTPPALAQWMQISDADVAKAYDEEHTDFVTPERRDVEQIVFPNLADAQAAAERINGGASFTDIAAARGLKPQDVDLGLVTKEGMIDPKVAAAAFSLKEGAVSAPIQTQFGAVLVAVQKIVPSVTKSLAEVTPQLRSRIALDRAKTQVQGLHDKIEDDRAGGMSLEQAAQKEKLPLATYDVDRSGRDASGKLVTNFSHGPDIVSAAFASDVGVDSDPLDAEGGYIWYDVAAITPARDRTLDEVKPEVEQHWRNDQIAIRLKAKADDLLGKLKNGNTLDALAKGENLIVDTAADLKRGGSSGGVTANMTNAIFHTPKDGFGNSVGDNPTQWIVFQVTGVNTPKFDSNSADAKHIDQTLRNQISDDVIGQYVAWVENKLGTSVNASVLTEAMGSGAPETD